MKTTIDNDNEREKLFNRLLNLIKNNPSGFTASATGKKLNLHKGYAVSVTDNREKNISELINKAIALNHLSSIPFYFGYWNDNGTGVLDLTRITEDKTDAINTAKKFKQKAIFDFSSFTEIKTK